MVYDLGEVGVGLEVGGAIGDVDSGDGSLWLLLFFLLEQ